VSRSRCAGSRSFGNLYEIARDEGGQGGGGCSPASGVECLHESKASRTKTMIVHADR
jgi:hypothetical protein